MKFKLTPITLTHSLFTVQGFFLKPLQGTLPMLAIGTHGYTSDKTSILNWGQKLANLGCPCLIFDLPGHYQGSFNDIQQFSDFTNHAHELFELAIKKSHINFEDLILMGHSLGAFLSLKATNHLKVSLSQKNIINICVGLGMQDEKMPHLMETNLYKPTLDFRRQLVSPQLAPELVFKWLKEQKQSFKITNQKIALINGQDDAVVNSKSHQNLTMALEASHNTVITKTPHGLPHHRPDMASPHIIEILKKGFKVF